MTDIVNSVKDLLGMDPVEKADPDMRRVIETFDALQAKPLEKLSAQQAREQPSVALAAQRTQEQLGLATPGGVLAIQTREFSIRGPESYLSLTLYAAPKLFVQSIEATKESISTASTGGATGGAQKERGQGETQPVGGLDAQAQQQAAWSQNGDTQVSAVEFAQQQQQELSANFLGLRATQPKRPSTGSAVGGLRQAGGKTDAVRRAAPVVLYFHGGGFVVASPKTYDATPRSIAAQTNMLVISCSYRQAPEHKLPAAHEDAFAAYCWAVKNVHRLGGDPTQIALMGESAGGNLALNVALRARDAGIQPPVALELIYPVVDINPARESYQSNSNARPLNRPMMFWFLEQSLRDATDKQSAWLQLVDADLRELPPTLVVSAGIDPLSSEDHDLVMALHEAGVSTQHRHYPGATHEFFGMATVVQAARDAQEEVCAHLKRHTQGEKAQMDHQREIEALPMREAIEAPQGVIGAELHDSA